MFKFIARRWAKAAYVFRQEVEADTNVLNAGLALRTAAEKHKLAAQLTEQADQMDARIKEVAEMEEKGYWICDKCGTEDMVTPSVSQEEGHAIHCKCGEP